ncbi:MAG TPA: hypothetical protein VD866_33060 [Urbifossiella sp.]|nr:hypothetical protein [Urbifossiella sp.]
MMHVFDRSRVWCVPLLAAVFALGCGGAEGERVREVRGTVTYKGQPLQSGTVRVVGANNEVAFAVVHKDGSFILTDVPPGEVKVGVIQGNEPRNVGDSSGKKAERPGKPVVVLPKKFHDPETSGFTTTVAPDTTRLDIDFS